MTMPDPRRQAAGEGGLDPEVTRRLRERRQLMLNGPLDSEQATRLAAELMTLEGDGPEPVTLTVNSPGGDLPALFTVTDTLAGLRAPVGTRCLGQARGTAAALVAAGTGRRQAGRHAQLVLELPRADASGSPADLDRAARAESGLAEQLFELLARCCGRPVEDVRAEWERGRVLTADDAADAGLIDDVADGAGGEG